MSSSLPSESASDLTSSVPRWAGRFPGSLRQWLHGNWRNTVIDVRQLSPQLRYLTILGYAVAIGYLLLIVLFEMVGDLLPRVPFSYVNNDDPAIATFISPIVLFFYALSAVIGWALILTGASDCRRRIYLPVLAIFSIQYLLTSSVREGTSPLLGSLQLAVFGVIILITAIYLFAPHLPVFRSHPLLEFVIWSGLLIPHAGGAWIAQGNWQMIAKDLVTSANVLVVLAAPFWFWLAVDAASLVKEYSYFVTEQVQARLSVVHLRWLTPLLAALPIPLYFVAPNFYGAAMGILLSPFLFVGVLLILLVKRGQRGTVIALFWLVVAMLLYSIFTGLAQTGSDIVELAIGATGLIPPTVLFAGLLLYDIASFGTRAAATDGRILPRSGRLLLYLGSIILASGFTLLIFNLRDATTNEPVGTAVTFINGVIFLSLLFFGPIYLVWSFWRERKSFENHTLPVETAVPPPPSETM